MQSNFCIKCSTQSDQFIAGGVLRTESLIFKVPVGRSDIATLHALLGDLVPLPFIPDHCRQEPWGWSLEIPSVVHLYRILI